MLKDAEGSSLRWSVANFEPPLSCSTDILRYNRFSVVSLWISKRLHGCCCQYPVYLPYNTVCIPWPIYCLYSVEHILSLLTSVAAEKCPVGSLWRFLWCFAWIVHICPLGIICGFFAVQQKSLGIYHIDLDIHYLNCQPVIYNILFCKPQELLPSTSC